MDIEIDPDWDFRVLRDNNAANSGLALLSYPCLDEAGEPVLAKSIVGNHRSKGLSNRVFNGCFLHIINSISALLIAGP